MEDKFEELQSQLKIHAQKRIKRNPRLSLETEDLVQEGMAAMWVAWLHYKDSNKTPEHMRGLLFKAAFNRMCDSERKARCQTITTVDIDRYQEELQHEPNLQKIVDLRFNIRTVASNLSDAGQRLFKELLNPSDDLLRRARYRRGFNVRDYAESLGLNDRTVKLAIKEIKVGMETSGLGFRLYLVRGKIRTREEMERDKRIDPLDYGLTVPDPEEEVGWDPALEERVPEAFGLTEEESREDVLLGREPGGVVDLDQSLGDLGEMGAEIAREEAEVLSSKTEEKLDVPEPKPKRKSRRKKDKNEIMQGFEPGTEGGKIWAHLEELLKTRAITQEDVRQAYKTLIGSDDEKAKRQARSMMWNLHREKKLLTRIERGVFERARDVAQ